MYLWGLVMSGRMDAKRVSRLFPYIASYAEKDGRNLEILFHPGRVLQGEDHPELSAGDAAFVRSENRDVEYEAVSSVRL